MAATRLARLADEGSLKHVVRVRSPGRVGVHRAPRVVRTLEPKAGHPETRVPRESPAVDAVTLSRRRP